MTALLDASGSDPDPRARAAALGALARAVPVAADAPWRVALGDPDAGVRRRACELAPDVATTIGPVAVARDLLPVLADRDVTVVEAAAWALGELTDDAVAAGAVAPLAELAGAHRDALAREAAVAALGALGDDAGLPAILAACTDKPAVRRRAVLALAPFDGPEVDAAIEAALTDRDWQVRQAAEDLLGIDASEAGDAVDED
ncbi:MAG: HEAT repeat domain-containing protein [Acidimicrobiia bacterium]